MPDPQTIITVEGLEGLRGTLQEVPATESAELRLVDGRRVRVPTGMLQRRDDGTYFLPLRPVDLTGTHYDSADENSLAAASVVERIPVVQEQLQVATEKVQTGQVRVH